MFRVTTKLITLLFSCVLFSCGGSNNSSTSEDDALEYHVFTAKSELEVWADRAVNGPYKERGDAFESSPGSYSRIKAYAEQLSDYEEEVVIEGSCVTLDSDESTTMLGSDEFGSIDVAREAAFVDFVEGTNLYTSTVKSLLLEQAVEPCMDFSDRELYPYDNKDGVWLYAEWIHKVLLTYDYLGRNAFSEDEQEIMDNWFQAAADWFDYTITDRSMDNLYTVRAGLPEAYAVDFTYWANTGVGTQRYKDSSLFHAPGTWINNRQLGIANYITHVGVMYDNDVWKEIGAQLAREYISFHFDDNGYYAELIRSTESTPMYGVAYGANTLINIAEIAHVLNTDGYTNLFEYESYSAIDPDTGDIISGTVNKSLEWVVLSFRKNFMLSSAPEIYPYENTTEDTSQLIHLCLNDTDYAAQVAGRFYSSAAVINNYYNNPEIAELYSSEYGNLCGVVSNDHIRMGPHAITPSFLFQYADIK